jgi:glycosyltransferase involved in cell wall biosynthesis
MKKPSAAIIITTYNHVEYIEQTLLSALNQANEALELKVIVVDDCSQDGTVAKLNHLKELYDFEFIKLPKNLGAPASRNVGIKVAGTKYISFLDGDDYLLGGKLARQVKAMESYPDVAVCYSDCLIERDGEIEREPLSKHWPPATGLVYTHLLLRNCIASHAALMKTSLAKKYKFDESLNGVEDYEFWLRLALNGELYLYLDEPLVVYRRVSGSLSTPSQLVFDKVLRVLDIYEPHISTEQQRLNIIHHRSVILQNKADLFLHRYSRKGVGLLADASRLEILPRYKIISLKLMRMNFLAGVSAYKILDFRSRWRAQREQRKKAKELKKKWVLVGIDIRALQSDHRFRGIGHLLSSCLRAISQIESKNIYALYSLTDVAVELPELDNSFKYYVKPVKAADTGLHWLMDSYKPHESMSWTKGVGVFLQPEITGGLPPKNIKSIVLLHDLIPLLFRKFYLPAWHFSLSPKSLRYNKRALGARLIFRRQLKMYRLAWRVLAISESTKRDALTHLRGLKSGKVKVVPLAADQGDAPDDAVAISGVNKKFIFYIGSIDYRKNIDGLISVFNEVRREGSDIQLVLAGNDFSLPSSLSPQAEQLRNQINSSPYAKDILVLGYVSNQQRAWLYKRAMAFVFPSLYEGFGLPILEAMAAGCPVIALNNSSIPEVAGNGALLLQSTEDIIQAIEELINNPKMAEDLRRKGLMQAKKFSWEQTAKQIIKVVDEAGK